MSAINITTLITDAKEENGVMNEMMELVQTYLAAEYRANRIDSNDYAQVYLSSLNGVMDKALQFALNKDKMSAELEILKIQKDIALIEKSKLEQEKLLIAAQVSKVTAETLLIEENTLTSVKQKLQIQAEIDVLKEKRNTEKKQTSLFDYKIKTERANTDSSVIGSNSMLFTSRATNLAQIDILKQKLLTERAQVSSTGVSSTSLIGRQTSLLETQRQGFLRDAEQNAAKIAVNAWSVDKSVSGDSVNTQGTGLDNPSVGRYMAKLYNGIR